MPTKLDLFLNGNPHAQSETERKGRKVMAGDLKFTHRCLKTKEAWNIVGDDMDEFYRLYCNDLRNTIPRYLTEKSTPIGQVRVDLDFVYEGHVEEHKHTQPQVIAFMSAFMEYLRKYVKVPDTVEIYVLEKSAPTQSIQKSSGATISKSGVHIQIPDIRTRAGVEQGVRRELIHRMDEFFPDLGCMKGWEDVYDKQPLTHTNNWMVLGSKKHDDGSLPYQIRYVLDWDAETGEISVDNDVSPVVTVELAKRLSTRSQITEETPLTDYGDKNTRPPAEPREVIRSVSRGRSAEPGNAGSRSSSPGRLYIEELSEHKQKYVEAHVMNLKEDRYINYTEWIAVGQCLKNIHPILEETWLNFSAQVNQKRPGTYDQRECLSKWQSFGFRVDGERLGINSLRYWSRIDNPDRFREIEDANIDRLVNNAAERETEYDFAQVINAKYQDEFKCANYKQNEWYRYAGHIWRLTENGVELQKRIPSDIAKLFYDKEQECGTFAQNNPCSHSLKEPDPTCQTCTAIAEKKMYWNAWLKLRRTGFAESVMKQCKLIFYDREFAKKLDDNKHLIAFKNGIYDTLTQTFRDGVPEDYVSFCTNIDYKEDMKYHQFECWSELESFLHSILPTRSVRDYFLKHLATCLSGVFTQRFHILTGSGSNGKSMLMNLCATAFGEYCYKANIAMFTQKRGKAGAANPELVRMKGKRFVMMSEPDEGEPLSTGFMKEITSSEKVTGRDLFANSKEMVEFDVQAKCHLACNDKPKVNTSDGGTWRRLKVIDFPTKFVHDPKLPHERPMDESIMHKVLSPEWAECFMAYLVALHKEGKGLTKLTPPKEVDAYTQEYQQESDVIARFMTEMFHAEGGVPGQMADPVQWNSITSTFQEWKRSNEVMGRGSATDLRKRIEAQYGKMPRGGWTNFQFGTN
jgi:P4 family phage/plasmid primase-like protien